MLSKSKNKLYRENRPNDLTAFLVNFFLGCHNVFIHFRSWCDYTSLPQNSRTFLTFLQNHIFANTADKTFKTLNSSLKGKIKCPMRLLHKVRILWDHNEKWNSKVHSMLNRIQWDEKSPNNGKIYRDLGSQCGLHTYTTLVWRVQRT